MKEYLKRLAELAVAGFIAGAGEYIATSGVQLTSASLQGLVTAAGLVAYGLVVKQLGDDADRPTVK